ncbi:MAG: protein-glutamate O-methyltransferase CheR [Oscillospiraceae bacterium]|jgi:chemotaxis protein methyltransferase CheR|nr:protein-glutamate O-methyltransferase CheR [Oscillospiraceae bacterium]
MEGQHISNEEFTTLVRWVKDNYGVNLERKATLVEGRLWNVIKQKGFSSLKEYFDYAVADKSGLEIKTLLTRLTTNYTYFMREDIHYTFLTDTVLPELIPRLRVKDLRIWSAGCSSGEEPYTAAMVLDDYFGSSKSAWDAKILATDISPQVLQMAKEAVYPEDRLQNLPPAWKTKYFSKEPGNHFRVKDFLRKEVILSSFNLMDTFPFRKPFHVIFCRNVMIYFDKPTRDALIERYYDALEPGGYLFIGLSETVDKAATRFEFVKPSIYRKP